MLSRECESLRRSSMHSRSLVFDFLPDRYIAVLRFAFCESKVCKVEHSIVRTKQCDVGGVRRTRLLTSIADTTRPVASMRLHQDSLSHESISTICTSGMRAYLPSAARVCIHRRRDETMAESLATFTVHLAMLCLPEYSSIVMDWPTHIDCANISRRCRSTPSSH